jgi:hypothetical protein
VRNGFYTLAFSAQLLLAFPLGHNLSPVYQAFFFVAERKSTIMNQFVDRMIRAAKLDVHLYEEVEADKGAMGQAMGVVVLSSLAGGVGLMQQAGAMGVAISTVASLLGWVVWAFLTYIIGTKLLPEPQTQTDHGELLRTIGFSSAPGIIRIVGIIPVLNTLVTLLAGAWMLVAMVIAVRQALDYHSTYRAIGVCVIGWLVQAVFLGGLVAMMGGIPELVLDR